MSFENASTAQKVRAAVHRDVRSICSETCHFLGLDITKPAMDIVAELVFRKVSVYGADLEAFAKHAKRTTINPDDVKLLVRRNPSLKSHLNSIMPTTTIASKDKRRKTIAAPVARQPEATPVPSTVPTTDVIHKGTETEIPAEVLENMAVDDTIDLTFD